MSSKSKAPTKNTEIKAKPEMLNKDKKPETTEIEDIWGPSSLATRQLDYLPNPPPATAGGSKP